MPGSGAGRPLSNSEPIDRTSARELSDSEIEQIVVAFGIGARRAVESGFDGVHIHAANGYLISEFLSPATNRRIDKWGGSTSGRSTLLHEVVREVVKAVPEGFPVGVKLGMGDLVPGGTSFDDSLTQARLLADAGVEMIEVSCGLMAKASDSAHIYVAVDARMAAKDLLFGRLVSPSQPEAYFRDWGRSLSKATELVIMLTGGIRTPTMMRSIVSSGDADLVGLARPLIREPDYPAKLKTESSASPRCTSCNLCMDHSGQAELRCWRAPKSNLFKHLSLQMMGRLSQRTPRGPIQLTKRR